MDLSGILAELIGGAVGGGAGGKIVKDSDLGNIGNIIAGAIGGLGGGSIAGALLGGVGGDAAAGLDIGALASQFVGSVTASWANALCHLLFSFVWILPVFLLRYFLDYGP